MTKLERQGLTMTGDPSDEKQSDSSESPPANGFFARLRRRFVEIGLSPLPLQDETTTFILVNVLDIFVTYMLLRVGGSEANPVARFFLHHWGFDGMIFFKMGIITFFCVVTQYIAKHNLKRAIRLMQMGTVIVTCVVIYGSWLLVTQIY